MDPAGPTAPSAASTASKPEASTRRATVKPASSRTAAVAAKLNARVNSLTVQVRALKDVRNEVVSNVPAASVAPVGTVGVDAPINRDAVRAAFPFVCYEPQERSQSRRGITRAHTRLWDSMRLAFRHHRRGRAGTYTPRVPQVYFRAVPRSRTWGGQGGSGITCARGWEGGSYYCIGEPPNQLR